jgi:hypothetical protein
VEGIQALLVPTFLAQFHRQSVAQENILRFLAEHRLDSFPSAAGHRCILSHNSYGPTNQATLSIFRLATSQLMLQTGDKTPSGTVHLRPHCCKTAVPRKWFP